MIKNFNFLIFKKLFLSSVVVLAFFFYVAKVQQERTTIKGQLAEDSEILVFLASEIITSDLNYLSEYRNGVYLGTIIDATYGFIEVEIEIKDNIIYRISLLQYPNHHDYSILINPLALPYLATEAITKQTAQVDGYSGATFTSNAFRRSLQSALDQAML